MSCGMPCWTCGRPIPPERHSLPEIQRVFCSPTCRVNFAYQGSDAQRQARETFCSNCGPLDEPGVHNQPDCIHYQP